MNPLSLLLALLSLLLYLAIICGPANGQVAPATDSATSRLTLTILPAVQIETAGSSQESSVNASFASFELNLWANTAWSLSEPHIAGAFAEQGQCLASQERGTRNLSDAPQRVSVTCMQPLSWADGPGLREITLQQLIVLPLSE